MAQWNPTFCTTVMNAPSEPQLQAVIPASRQTPRKKKARWWVFTALVIAVASGTAWWLGSRASPVTYATAMVERGSLTKAISATGTVNPVLTVLVGTYVSGVVQQVFCDYNTRVKRGQICAKIDPRPYQSIVDQHRANLATAKAQLAKDEATLTYAQLASERDAKLLTRGIVSKEVAEASQSAHGQARAQIALDRATIEQRAAELRAAEVNLGYTEIVSPVDGTVVSRNVTMGQTVAASFQTPTLFLIATDLTRMQVDTNVSESDISGARLGASALFSVEAYPGRTFQAAVSQVRQSPQTVQNVVTYDVVATVANPELLLKPGMTATVRLIVAAREDVLRVPNAALRYTPRGTPKSGDKGPDRRGEQRGEQRAKTTSKPAPNSGTESGSTGQVWVLDAGTPRRVEVATGIEDENWTEITGGGLKAGDALIVSEANGATRARRAAPPMKF